MLLRLRHIIWQIQFENSKNKPKCQNQAWPIYQNSLFSDITITICGSTTKVGYELMQICIQKKPKHSERAWIFPILLRLSFRFLTFCPRLLHVVKALLRCHLSVYKNIALLHTKLPLSWELYCWVYFYRCNYKWAWGAGLSDSWLGLAGCPGSQRR